MAPLPAKVDVLVVGSGNAGLSAAISAAETFPPASPSSPSSARRVLLVDACPEAWFGGNTYFTAGAFRAAHAGLADLLPLVNNVSGDEHARRIDLEPYPASAFARDLDRVCLGRSDPELARVLVDDSNGAVKWLAGHGVRFQLSFNRQAYEVDGRIKFWGGLALKTQDGGKGLVQDLRRAASSLGVQIACSAAVKNLLFDDDDDDGGGGGSDAVSGAVIVTPDGVRHVVRTPSVIMAAGGFEANPRLRSQYLGPGWDMAKVRGTPYNTGLCLETCLREPVCARPAGNWSGCHSVAWDADAPSDGGDRATSNEFTKSGYPLGLMVNLEGERFVDEGLDLRNFTYAVFGRAILAQPGRAAFQVWDARTVPWLRDEEYRDAVVAKIRASSLEELAQKCAEKGLRDPQRFIRTITEYNEAVALSAEENPDRKWDPAVKDGVSTQSSRKSLPLAKSNWALPLDQAPFVAVKVTCGVTFTFGGLAVEPETAGVVSALTGKAIPGLYCAGEMVGGLFYDNYPGGSGLTSGTVFGRRAGKAAAARAQASMI